MTVTLISIVGGSDLNLPEIKIGPYNPWRWDSKLLTSLEQHQPLIKAHPGSSKHFPRHQARYETNITVDPHRIKVELSSPSPRPKQTKVLTQPSPNNFKSKLVPLALGLTG